MPKMAVMMVVDVGVDRLCDADVNGGGYDWGEEDGDDGDDGCDDGGDCRGVVMSSSVIMTVALTTVIRMMTVGDDDCDDDCDDSGSCSGGLRL